MTTAIHAPSYVRSASVPAQADTGPIPLSRLGDQRLWREDISWLADQLAERALRPHAGRLRWLHVVLQRLDSRTGTTAVRIQLDLAGHDLLHLTAVERCPQAALCSAFRQIEDHLSDYHPTAA